MSRFYYSNFDLINDSLLLQNRLLGWGLANAQENYTLPQPVLAIYLKQVRSSLPGLKPSTLVTINAHCLVGSCS